MQAPTTPSGAPVQEPGARTCAGCGATNGAEAAFCWQCYRSFSAPATPVATRSAAPGLRGPNGIPSSPISLPAPLPSPAPAASTLMTIARIAVPVVAAVIGYLFFANRGPDVALPEALGGLQRIENQQVELLVGVFREQAETEGFSADLGVYGNAGLPTAALVWVEDGSLPDADAAYEEFAVGFNEGLGTGGLLGDRTTEVVGGVEYLCAPIEGQPPASLCMWQAEGVFWVLIDLSGTGTLADARDLSVLAHDAAAA